MHVSGLEAARKVKGLIFRPVSSQNQIFSAFFLLISSPALFLWVALRLSSLIWMFRTFEICTVFPVLFPFPTFFRIIFWACALFSRTLHIEPFICHGHLVDWIRLCAFKVLSTHITQQFMHIWLACTFHSISRFNALLFFFSKANLSCICALEMFIQVDPNRLNSMR